MGDDVEQLEPPLMAEPVEVPEDSGPPPVDERKRMGQAKAARRRRLTAKIKRSDLTEAQQEEIHRILEGKPAPKPVAVAAADPIADALPPEAAAQLAALANLNGIELAGVLWSSLDTIFLADTRYALNEKKRKALVDVTGPVLDKYLPSLGNTPEAQFLTVTAIIFGPPALQHLLEKRSAQAKLAQAAAKVEEQQRAA